MASDVESSWTVSPALVGYTCRAARGDIPSFESVVFADADQTESLEIQGGVGGTFTENEIRLGLDGYCIASNTIVGAVYNNPITRWSCHEGTVTFVLDDKGAQVFEARTWTYVCDPTELDKVTDAITRITGLKPDLDESGT